jgi:DNA-binding NtrC family response regulator
MSASTPSCSRQKILLIDDDELIADSLRQYLVTNGCEVDVAQDAASAKVLMMSTKYQVILVDPYLTGEIHRRDTALMETVPLLQPGASVFVVTGYGSPELTQVGAHPRLSFVTKPQSVLALSEMISAALHNGAPSLSTQSHPSKG